MQAQWDKPKTASPSGASAACTQGQMSHVCAKGKRQLLLDDQESPCKRSLSPDSLKPATPAKSLHFTGFRFFLVSTDHWASCLDCDSGTSRAQLHKLLYFLFILRCRETENSHLLAHAPDACKHRLCWWRSRRELLESAPAASHSVHWQEAGVTTQAWEGRRSIGIRRLPWEGRSDTLKC